ASELVTFPASTAHICDSSAIALPYQPLLKYSPIQRLQALAAIRVVHIRPFLRAAKGGCFHGSAPAFGLFVERSIADRIVENSRGAARSLVEDDSVSARPAGCSQ